MRPTSVPRLGPLYWLTLSSASVFGTNTGDMMSHTLGLGDASGLPYLAILFAAILLAERWVRVSGTVFYWLAIIVMRTAATNLADLATLQAELDYTSTIAVLAVLLIAILRGFRLIRRATGPVAGIPSTGAGYWLAMLAAATLGTALGDYGSHTLTLHVCVVVTVLLFVAVFRPVRWAGSNTVLYWVAVVIARTAGTNVGDLLAFKRGLNLGLPACALLTGLVFAALVAAGNRPGGLSRRAGSVLPGTP